MIEEPLNRPIIRMDAEATGRFQPLPKLLCALELKINVDENQVRAELRKWQAGLDNPQRRLVWQYRSKLAYPPINAEATARDAMASTVTWLTRNGFPENSEPW